MKILGLDFGDRRIGVAISEKKIVASYGVIEAGDLHQSIREIGRICREEKIEKIIIGMPKSPTIWSESDIDRRTKNNLQADIVSKFALELAKTLNLETEFVDETLTSKEAERRLEDSKLEGKSKKYKEEVDKISAKLILEQYLNKNQ